MKIYKEGLKSVLAVWATIAVFVGVVLLFLFFFEIMALIVGAACLVLIVGGITWLAYLGGIESERDKGKPSYYDTGDQKWYD